MQREWTDPRDGTCWLVTSSPFGFSFEGSGGEPAGGLTVAFHRRGRQPMWTRYSAERPLDAVGDQELMDLLDAASRERVQEKAFRPVRAKRRSGRSAVPGPPAP